MTHTRPRAVETCAEAGTDGSASNASSIAGYDEVAAENARLRTEVEHLRTAMETRPVIEQARGILMSLTSCSPATSWRLLVEASQHSNVKLRVVSAALVASAGGDPLPREIRPALHGGPARTRSSTVVT